MPIENDISEMKKKVQGRTPTFSNTFPSKSKRAYTLGVAPSQ